MTLPTDLDLPLKENYENEQEYIKDVVFELQEMYDNIVQSVNGFIRNNAEVDQAKWTPTLNGTTPGTFTYSHRVGWSVRQGIFTQLFFDMAWSATTAAGTLYLELPYKVTLSLQKPFVGVLQPSGINFGAGMTNLVINALPNTYKGEVWSIGSTMGTPKLAVPAVGQLIGSLFYIGIEDE